MQPDSAGEQSVSLLMDDLVDDPWRVTHGFTPEVQRCSDKLFCAASDERRGDILSEWLAQHQPCIFGKMAARKGGVEFCFLTDDDLLGSDLPVQRKILSCRRAWRETALRGERSAFVIVALSERITVALPNLAAKRLALKLASLYLCAQVQPDEVKQDALFLEAAGFRRRWRVGVNYFSSHGDGRWWKDHRIPGGMAFSMNSVGHMALCQRAIKKYDDSDPRGLLWALQVAMQLIDDTTPGISGRNTRLFELSEVAATLRCPFSPPPRNLQTKNFCVYEGQYHTDVTVPSEYFDPCIERPASLGLRTDLDLTYLHNDAPDNPDYREIGAGVDTEN